MFKISFITECYSLAEYLFFDTLYGPDTIPGNGDVAEQNGQNSCPCELPCPGLDHVECEGLVLKQDGTTEGIYRSKRHGHYVAPAVFFVPPTVGSTLLSPKGNREGHVNGRWLEGRGHCLTLNPFRMLLLGAGRPREHS